MPVDAALKATRRAPAAGDPPPGVVGGAAGDRDRRAVPRRHPAGDLPAPHRAQGRRARDRAARRRPAASTGRTRRRWPSCARSSTTTGPPASSDCATSPRPSRPASDTREGTPLMAELVREIMIDATPETIWPFLVDPDKHVEWMGTVADIDPRPGGVVPRARRRPEPVGGRVRRGRAPREGRVHLRVGAGGQPDHAGLDAPSRSPCTPRATRRACGSCTAGIPDDAVSDHTQRLGPLPRPPRDRRDRRRRRARRPGVRVLTHRARHHQEERTMTDSHHRNRRGAPRRTRRAAARPRRS